jgi:hypothetical protein
MVKKKSFKCSLYRGIMSKTQLDRIEEKLGLLEKLLMLFIESEDQEETEEELYDLEGNPLGQGRETNQSLDWD